MLDPIVSLRQTIRLPPGRHRAASRSRPGYADNEAARERLIEKYHDRRAVARALALASTHSQIELRHLGLTVEDTIRFQRLAGRMIYGDPRLRVGRSGPAQPARPVASCGSTASPATCRSLLRALPEDADLPLFHELLKAHEYLRVKGFTFDLVVLNEHASSYRQDLQDALQQMRREQSRAARGSISPAACSCAAPT